MLAMVAVVVPLCSSATTKEGLAFLAKMEAKDTVTKTASGLLVGIHSRTPSLRRLWATVSSALVRSIRSGGATCAACGGWC